MNFSKETRCNFIEKLNKIIEYHNKQNLKSKANSIKHYLQEHNDVPIWILTNYMTYGQISKFYAYLPDKLRNIIAKDMLAFMNENIDNEKNILTPKELESFLYNIVEVRNIIAHNNKILGFKCKGSPPYNKFIYKSYNISKQNQRQSIFDVYIMLSCFLSKNEYEQLGNGVKKRMRKLNNKIDKNVARNVIESLGFFDSFYNEPKQTNIKND